MNPLFETITNWQWIPSGFRYPWVLLLMGIPLLLLCWIWIRRSRAVAIPVDFTGRRPGHLLRTIVNLAESLSPVLLALAIWLAAGPLQLGKPEMKRALTNILFCIDVSGSMTSKFGSGTCYDASLDAIDRFLDLRDGDAFGLLFFGNSVLRWTPLTNDVSAIRCAPPFMRPENLPAWFGGTAIGTALLECRKVLLEQEEGDRMIILVSDGMSSDLMGGNDEAIARRLVDASITMYGIHIGGGEAPADVATIAALTGGEVFAPGNESALASVFARIDNMKRAEMKKTIAQQQDNFQPYIAVASLVGIFAVLFSYGARFTPW